MSSSRELIHPTATPPVAAVALREITNANLALQTRALNSVGILSRGLAHDINSPLQVLSDATFLLREGLAELGATANPSVIDGLRLATDQASQAFDRLRVMTKSVALLVAPSDPSRSLVRLEVELGIVQALTRHEWHRDVDLTVNADPRISLASIPRPLLRQLLVDLVLFVVHQVVESRRQVPGGSGERGSVVIRASRADSRIVIEVVAEGLPTFETPIVHCLDYEPLLSRLGATVTFASGVARAELPSTLASSDELFT